LWVKRRDKKSAVGVGNQGTFADGEGKNKVESIGTRRNQGRLLSHAIRSTPRERKLIGGVLYKRISTDDSPEIGREGHEPLLGTEGMVLRQINSGKGKKGRKPDAS